MNQKRDDDPDFVHLVKIAVYALGAMALMWAFITFVELNRFAELTFFALSTY